MMTLAENKQRIGNFWAFGSMPLSVRLFLLVIIALIPRIIVFFQPQIITNDGMLYIKMARLFSEGQYGGTPGSYFNLYPFLIFLVQKLVGDWELSGGLISLILGTLTIIPVFLLGRSLYDEKIGWLSALFYIFLPNFLKFDTNVLRDPTLWCFMAFALWLVWEGLQKNRPILLAIAGISAGLGAMTRVEGFILWGTLSLYAAFRRLPRISLRKKIFNVTLLVVIFPLIVSAVLLTLEKNSGQMALNEMVSFSVKFMTAHTLDILKPADPIARMDSKVYKSLPSISQDSLELASRHRVALAFFEVIYKFIKSANVLIVLIGFGFWRKKKEGFVSSDKYLLYVFAVLFLMSILYARQLYYFSTRHGLTLVLPCLFFAGHGLGFIVETFSRESNRLTSGWTLIKKYPLHILTILFIIIFLSQGISFKRTEKFNQKEIGLWLKEKGFEDSVIMGPKTLLRLGFYADGEFLEMPDSYEKVVDCIQRNGVKIVVIDSCTIDQDCPGFLANWPQAGLFPLQGPKGKGEKCVIQIYGVY
jgi:hypothetical protein